MSANRIAVSWQAGWSSSAMRANMPWLPRDQRDDAGGRGRRIQDRPPDALAIGIDEREGEVALREQQAGLQVGELAVPRGLRLDRIEQADRARLLVEQHRADGVGAARRVVRHQRDVGPRPAQRLRVGDHPVQLRDAECRSRGAQRGSSSVRLPAKKRNWLVR